MNFRKHSYSFIFLFQTTACRDTRTDTMVSINKLCSNSRSLPGGCAFQSSEWTLSSEWTPSNSPTQRQHYSSCRQSETELFIPSQTERVEFISTAELDKTEFQETSLLSHELQTKGGQTYHICSFVGETSEADLPEYAVCVRARLLH